MAKGRARQSSGAEIEQLFRRGDVSSTLNYVMMKLHTFSFLLIFSLLLQVETNASDWLRFRGSNGSGINHADDTKLPQSWSNDENLKWKVELPGPGHSSPIVVGDKVLLTYWTGSVEDEDNFRYHLLCVNRSDGSTAWSTEIAPELPESPHSGMHQEHGYATHTPTSDGEHIYAFFGKTGVAAFDLEGNKVWHKSVGTGLDQRGWGSASSPILYKDFVIVLASIENGSLVALNKKTGKEEWKAEASGLERLWGTPILADRPDGGKDLVVVTNGEIWGLNPDSGKLRWFCEGPTNRSISISAISSGNMVYALGNREGGTTAVKAGGKGDVTETHKLWESSRRGGTGTPVYHDGRLHWIESGVAYALDAKTGEEVYRLRATEGEEVAAEPSTNRGFGRGGREYSSPVISGGNLIQVTKSGSVMVVKLGEKYELLAVNTFTGDDSGFVATPAISAGNLIIRSTKYLYCVGTTE